MIVLEKNSKPLGETIPKQGKIGRNLEKISLQAVFTHISALP